MGSVVVVMVETAARGGTDPLVTGTAVGGLVDCGGSDLAALQGALDLQGMGSSMNLYNDTIYNIAYCHSENSHSYK